MNIYSILLLAISLALDAFAVSLAAGASKQKISFSYSILIASVFALFQVGMPLIGWGIGSVIADSIMAAGNIAAAALLFGIGARMIYESLKKNDAREQLAHSARITKFSVLLILAVATSIDALAAGVSLAFVRVALPTALVIIGVVTWVLSLSGLFLGKKFGELCGDKVEILGGLVLIFLGVNMLL